MSITWVRMCGKVGGLGWRDLLDDDGCNSSKLRSNGEGDLMTSRAEASLARKAVKSLSSESCLWPEGGRKDDRSIEEGMMGGMRDMGGNSLELKLGRGPDRGRRNATHGGE